MPPSKKRKQRLAASASGAAKRQKPGLKAADPATSLPPTDAKTSITATSTMSSTEAQNLTTRPSPPTTATTTTATPVKQPSTQQVSMTPEQRYATNALFSEIITPTRYNVKKLIQKANTVSPLKRKVKDLQKQLAAEQRSAALLNTQTSKAVASNKTARQTVKNVERKLIRRNAKIDQISAILDVHTARVTSQEFKEQTARSYVMEHIKGANGQYKWEFRKNYSKYAANAYSAVCIFCGCVCLSFSAVYSRVFSLELSFMHV